MIKSLQFFVGLLMGCLGFMLMMSNPLLGCCTLFLGGFFMLTAIDHWCRINTGADAGEEHMG